MIYRSFDVAEIVKAVSLYSDEVIGFHPEVWIADDKNIALTDGEGNSRTYKVIGKKHYIF